MCERKEKETQKHIEVRYHERTRIIVIENEIEEWICISQDYSINARPHKVLKREFRYKKRHLPKMIAKLDYTKLCNHSNSFKSFIDHINENF